MKPSFKAIIFDWGRTLYDSETKKEFLEAEDILALCKERGYRLALVSLVTIHANATLDERKNQIANSPLRKYFEIVAITDTDKDKKPETTTSGTDTVKSPPASEKAATPAP